MLDLVGTAHMKKKADIYKKLAKKGAVPRVQLAIDCAVPVEDNILDVASFEKFLHDRIKVDGVCGNFGNRVIMKRKGNSITFDAALPFSKRYLKFLTKKYLKHHQLRDFLRVLGTDSKTCTLRYFTIAANEDYE